MTEKTEKNKTTVVVLYLAKLRLWNQRIDQARANAVAIVNDSPCQLGAKLCFLSHREEPSLVGGGKLCLLYDFELECSFSSCDATIVYRNCSRKWVFPVQPSRL